MSTKRVKIHYRRLIRTGDIFPASLKLSSGIAAAMATQVSGAKVQDRVSLRVADVPGQPGFQRMLNTYHASGDYVFGTVCLFAPGQLQTLLKTADAAKGHQPLADLMAALEIAEAAAPAGHEYVHGMTYWMAVEDHFYQIQHTALQSKAMEEYLTWLLRDRTKAIGDSHAVALQWKFDRSQLADDELSSVEVGGMMPESFRPSPPPAPDAPDGGGGEQVVTDVAVRETVGERFAKSFNAAKKVLIELIGEVDTQKIIDAMPPDAALDVRVNIGFRSSKRRLQKQAMRDLETGLRNIADGEILVRGKNGEIKGDDARLSMDMGVKKISEVSGLLDPADAFRQMQEVHRRFIYDGKLVG